MCVGVGGLIVVLLILYVIKKRSSEGEGDYVAMNAKTGAV